MTVVKYQFWAFFRMVPEKMAICGKRWHFRAKGHFVKVVGNAILKTFCFKTFFLRRILWPQMTVEISLFLLIYFRPFSIEKHYKTAKK